MNPTQLSEPVRLNREGGTLEFVKLSPKSILALREKFRLVRKQQFIESLMFAGITGIEALKMLNQFDARRITRSAVTEWVNTLEGQYETVLLSLQQSGDTVDQAVLKVAEWGLDGEEMLTVAAGCLNLLVTSENPPDAASTQTMTETGGENATSSVTTADPAPTP